MTRRRHTTGAHAAMMGCLLALVAASCAAPEPRVAARRVLAEPIEPTPGPTPTPSPTPEPTAVPARPVATPTEAPAPAPAPAAGIVAFRGLGAWIDVFDTDANAATVLPFVRDMADKGVQTLYLETARYDDAGHFRYPAVVAAALEEAHRLGMKVVAWYPPDFADVEKDLARSLAAVRYRSPAGHRFDAFAPDIEYTEGVPDHDERSTRAVAYSKRLREAAGKSYPMAAIVIPPTSHEINPKRWSGFPWADLAPSYDVFMPMNYWTGRPGHDAAMVTELTSRNVSETKRLTGRPVHVIGGVADGVDEAEARAYVTASNDAGSIGGGLYDYRTTSADLYPILRKLRR